MASQSTIVYATMMVITILMLSSITMLILKTPVSKKHDLDCSSKIKTFIAQSNFKNKLSQSTRLVDLFTDKQNTIECSANRILIDYTDENKIYKTFADEYVNCHKQWTNDDGTFMNIFQGNGIFCNVCSIITFDPNVFDDINNPNIPLSYNHFEEYIQTHNYRDSKKGLIPYTKYFGKLDSNNLTITNSSTLNLKINPSQNYVVMMKYIKGEKEIETFYSSLQNRVMSGTYVLATTVIGSKAGVMIGSFFGPIGSLVGSVTGGITGMGLGLIRLIVSDSEQKADWFGMIYITDVSSAKLDKVFKCDILLGL